MRLFKGHENLGWRIHNFPWVTIHQFGGLKMPFLLCRGILKSNATGFMSGTLRHFGQLKMWFLNGHESLESKVSSFRCVNIRHFDGLKISYLRHSAQGYVATGGPIFYFMVGWKCVSWLVRDNQLKWTWLLVKAFFSIWRYENAIPQGSWVELGQL
jgi:hypothetical protein